MKIRIISGLAIHMPLTICPWMIWWRSMGTSSELGACVGVARGSLIRAMTRDEKKRGLATFFHFRISRKYSNIAQEGALLNPPLKSIHDPPCGTTSQTSEIWGRGKGELGNTFLPQSWKIGTAKTCRPRD